MSFLTADRDKVKGAHKKAVFFYYKTVLLNIVYVLISHDNTFTIIYLYHFIILNL